jgi:RNA polymerase sigma factor (sigma-70 family)
MGLLVSKGGERWSSYQLEDIKDFVSEVLLKVLPRLAKLAELTELSFYFYCWTAFNHRVFDEFRLRRNHFNRSMGQLPDEMDIVEFTKPELIELRESVNKALDRLPGNERMAIDLQQSGLALTEIARLARVCPRTVSNRLARARAHLRRDLSDFDRCGTPDHL